MSNKYSISSVLYPTKLSPIPFPSVHQILFVVYSTSKPTCTIVLVQPCKKLQDFARIVELLSKPMESDAWTNLKQLSNHFLKFPFGQLVGVVR